MKHWILHFENKNGHEAVREYPQAAQLQKWQDVIDMIHEGISKNHPFFSKYAFNGKCALVDLQKQKQDLANLIGKLIYN
jgi:hypothetical protein